MAELTAQQIGMLERLLAGGFQPALFPLYSNMVGIRRGAFAALLDPAGGALALVGEPCYVLDGNLCAALKDDAGRWFVWKGKRIAATAELLEEQRKFAADLAELLS